MESRWLRTFLLLAVIPVFLGITLKTAAAGEPAIIAEVRAYSTPEQAAFLAGGNVNTRSRAKVLYDVPVTAAARPNTMADISEVVVNIADKLLDTQRAADYGWPRDLNSGDTELLPNSYGVAGMGLLMAYEMTATLGTDGKVQAGDDRYLAAAELAGDKLVEKAQDPNVLLSTDIVFLYGLSQRSGDESYYSAGLAGINAYYAKTDANSVYKFYDCDGDANNTDRQVKHWNLASWVEAAKLYAGAEEDTNLDAWAAALMGKICLDQDAAGGFCFKEKDGVKHVRTAGQAKVVEVLKRFYEHTRSENLSKGLSYLLGLQSDSVAGGGAGKSLNGSFAWGGETGADNKLTPWRRVTLEDQCYGTQAMAYNLQTTRMNYCMYKKGTHFAARYLTTSMMGSAEGHEAFVDVDYDNTGKLAVPRVDRNSEAIQALYYSCKEGDVDRSGKVIACDALSVLKAGVGLVALNGPQLVAADRNNDGVINPADASIILKDSVGNYNPDYPIYSFLGK